MSSKKVNFAVINAAMKSNQPKNRAEAISDMGIKVCITNGKEVIRITRGEATEFFFDKVVITPEEAIVAKLKGFHVEHEGDIIVQYVPKNQWVYTSKLVWKQYKAGFNPQFTHVQKTWNKETKSFDEKVVTKNIFV